MKPRLKYADVFQALDFTGMAQGTPLELDGQRLTYEGKHHGAIWVAYKRRMHFLKAGDPAIARLRLAEQSNR